MLQAQGFCPRACLLCTQSRLVFLPRCNGQLRPWYASFFPVRSRYKALKQQPLVVVFWMLSLPSFFRPNKSSMSSSGWADDCSNALSFLVSTWAEKDSFVVEVSAGIDREFMARFENRTGIWPYGIWHMWPHVAWLGQIVLELAGSDTQIGGEGRASWKLVRC